MNYILVDSDILIDLAAEDETAIGFLEDIEEHSIPAVSIVTEMELVVGCRNKTELRHTERVLERFQVIPISETISSIASGMVKRYRLSHGLLIPDALIAATAITMECELATRNRRDYRFIEGLTLFNYPVR